MNTLRKAELNTVIRHIARVLKSEIPIYNMTDRKKRKTIAKSYMINEYKWKFFTRVLMYSV